MAHDGRDPEPATPTPTTATPTTATPALSAPSDPWPAATLPVVGHVVQSPPSRPAKPRWQTPVIAATAVLAVITFMTVVFWPDSRGDSSGEESSLAGGQGKGGLATPAAPNVTVDADAGGAVVVTWPPVLGARDYVVTPVREGGAGTDEAQTVSDTEAVFSGLVLGKSYTFTVVARAGSSAASEPSAPSEPVVPFRRPGAPGDVQAAQVGVGSYRVTWSAADANGSPVTGYRISGDDGAELAAVGGGATSATVSAARLSQVEVAAENAAGWGDPGVARVTSEEPPEEPPATTGPAPVSGVVTCVDRPSNPDPDYCAENGGIGVFTTPNPETNTDVGRLEPGASITVVCQTRGKSVNADIYNEYKRSDYWLQMDDGLYIPWIWVTLAGDDQRSLEALPSC